MEYKKGQSKVSDCDRIQLCAQSICLEEMCGVRIERAALWYWKTRKREWVEMNEDLRGATLRIIQQTKDMLSTEVLPKARWTKSCKSCSFVDECMPKFSDKSVRYIKELFQV